MKFAVNCIFILLLIPGFSPIIHAQEIIGNQGPYKIKYLTTNEGLPQNTVDCILKDSKGFMWFGTWNGLCRFDGYNFNIFQKQEEEGLSGNFIQSLAEDQDGNIWVGTENGLAFFDYLQMKFVPLQEKKIELANFSVTSILIDSQNRVWIATAENSIWKIEKNKDGTFNYLKVFEDVLPSENINDMLMIDNSHLLVATTEGISVILSENKTIHSAWKSIENALDGINVQTLFFDSKKEYWFGTAIAGVYRFNPETNQLNYYGINTVNGEGLTHLSVQDIIEDLNGNIIIGTLGGLNYFNRSSGLFTYLTDQSSSGESLNSPFVNSLYSDDLGNIWIGTEKGGINYYNAHQKPFYSIQNDPSNPNTLSHNIINSIYSENEYLWVGTAGGGLNKLTYNFNKIIHFETNSNNPNSLNNNFITSIHRDTKGQLWIGTWGGGLNRMINENRNSFEVFIHDDIDSESLENNFISTIVSLDKNHLLLGTNGGLDIFNPGDNIFIHVQDYMNETTAPEVGCLLIDSKNRVWMGTENGLYQFEKKDLLRLTNNNASISFKKYLYNPDDPNSIPGDFIISIFQSKDGTLWFGTYGNGICKLQEEGDSTKFITFSEQKGLCNNVAYAIEEDQAGNLWISTDNGLSKFNPKDEVYQNYSRSDGLLSNQFYWSASAKDNNGNIYFGGVEGLNYFNPSAINAYPYIPQPVFTDFSIFSQPVQIGKKYHSRTILEKPVSETREIELSYKDAVFSIEFSALDYFLPEKIEYAYQMEGVDQDWVYVSSNRRFANYTNLSGGEYTFKVKASNSDGVWSETPTTLKITVKPPFWETALFQILALLFVAIMVMIYIRSRIHFLKQQKRKLEKQVSERIVIIEEQKSELEKQNKKIARQRDEVIELNRKLNFVTKQRLRFFTNISHEFRTPLTLIIDPLEHLIQKASNDPLTRNTLGIINRNAQRLLHLINQLLYFRKVETGMLKLNVCKGNIIDYLHGIYESFKELAEHQKIDYRFHGTEINEETWFDPEKLENVIYNLLSNAFKNTPVSGSINMIIKLVSYTKVNNVLTPMLSISITDTGKGISKENLPHIFERFYSATENTYESELSGSGIGLALTQEIVKALNGEIKVESKPGLGSNFTVLIPFTKDRFDKKDINQESLPTDITIKGWVNALSDHIIAKESGYEQEEISSNDRSVPTLLIVDDNSDLRNFLRQTLHSDYRILDAENGKLGYEMACSEIPDVIVSDIMMPVMDGIEMCKLIKTDVATSHIPVILLTAKGSFDDQKTGYDIGADSYLTKPFSSDVLKSRINNILEAKKKYSLANPSNFKQKQELLNDSLGELDKEFLKKLTKVIEENLEDEVLSISQVAKHMNMSHSTLYRKIKALTNLTANEFIRKIRINYAEQLLLTGQYNISEIMYRVGINSSSYFRQCFRQEFGDNPSDYLQKLKKE